MAEEVDLDAELDHLYAQPLDLFVAERDALAKRLRAAGRRDDAAEVKALRRPAIHAWVVNQLAREQADAMARLQAAGDRLRAGDVGEGIAEQRAALRDLVSHAAGLLTEHGFPYEPWLERVRSQLLTLSSWGTAPPVAPGRLTGDVEAPDLADLLTGRPAKRRPAAKAPARPAPRPAPRRERPPEPPRPDPREVAAAEARVRDLQRGRSRLEIEVRDADARLARARAATERAREALAQAEAAEAAAREALERTQADAKAAAEAVTRAERERDALRRPPPARERRRAR